VLLWLQVFFACTRRANAERARATDERARIDHSRVLGSSLTQDGDDGAMATPSSISQLALYRALVVGGPLTTRELADRTGFEERCVREWLAGQADRGRVTYDANAEIFLLTPEQAARLDAGAHS